MIELRTAGAKATAGAVAHQHPRQRYIHRDGLRLRPRLRADPDDLSLSTYQAVSSGSFEVLA